MENQADRRTVGVNLLWQFLVATLLVALIPGLIIGYSALQGYQAAADAATTVADQQLDRVAIDGLKARADHLAIEVAALLDRAVQDTLTLASLPPDPQTYRDFLGAHTSLLWYPTGTRDQPGEDRRPVPLYREIAYIDATGLEKVRVLDQEIIPQQQLRNVADPANTTYRTETYFSETRALPPGQVYVSHLTAWHASTALQPGRSRKDVKEVDGAEYGRYVAIIRFATPVFDQRGVFNGIVMLALDHRHLMERAIHINPGTSGQNWILYPKGEDDNYAYMFDDEGYTIANPTLRKIRGLDEQGRLLPYTTAEMSDAERKKHPTNVRYDWNEPAKQNMFEAVLSRQSGFILTVKESTNTQRVTAYAPIAFAYGTYSKRGIFGGVAIGTSMDEYHKASASVREKVEAERFNQQLNIIVAGGVGILLLISAVWLVTLGLIRPLLALTTAARRMEEGELDSATLKHVLGRRVRDEVTRLARVFKQMAEQVQMRERALKEQLRELNIRVDQTKAEREVEEITDTEYFRRLAAGASNLRKRNAQSSGRQVSSSAGGEDDTGAGESSV
jgi:HAMP domain-containing protein